MGQVLGIGIDVIEVDRVAASIERFGERFLARVFTPSEVAYCRKKPRPVENFAARFAAKEAMLKALGTGWNHQTSFREVEVIRAEGAAPTISLSPRIRKLLPEGPVRVHLSISHTREYAVAQAMITREDSGDHDLL
jgi:holo-[acyl-carrier protein] synthase